MDTPVISSARDLRDLLLRDDPLTLEDLQHFIEGPGSSEGLYVDYKAADELHKSDKDRKHTIRQYVAAFANSEGGVLIIGVKEPTDDDRKKGKKPFIDPIDPVFATSIDKNGLKQWTAQVTRDLVGALGGPPRISVIHTKPTDDETPTGQILLVAVPRAPSLVSVINKGAPAYYFRIEDQAREVPQSLVVDLLLGRRSTPHLVVSAVGGKATVDETPVLHSDPHGRQTVRSTAATIELELMITNDSIVSARNITAGLIFMGRYDRPIDSEVRRTRHKPPVLPQSLLEYISHRDLRPDDDRSDPFSHAPSRLDMPHALHHILLTPRPSLSLRPFQQETVSITDEHALECVHLPAPTNRTIVFACALYLLPEDREPLWYQVSINLHGRNIKGSSHFGHNAPNKYVPVRAAVTITRCVGVRPIVGAAVEAAELTTEHHPTTT
jgi:hypothetical protein